MDHKTRPFEVYTKTPTNILDEDSEGSNYITNGQEQREKMELLHS